MKHIFVIEQEEFEQPLISLASAFAQFDTEKNKLRLAYVFETDSEDVAAIIKKNVPEIAASKKTTVKPNGTCVKCGREAQLVKVNKLCKPCHMVELRHPAKEEHKFVEREAKPSTAEERLQANIDKVVAKAKAKGESGTVSLPMAASGSPKSARKLG